MERRKSGLARGLLATAAVFAALVIAGCALVDSISGASGEAEAELVRSAVRSAALTCYAVEGAYPADLGYLSQHYGLRYNAERFIVVYDAFASNVLPDIRVLDAQVVPEDFHARYAAHTKTYLYRIHNSPIDSPFDEKYYTRVPRRLDTAKMNTAARRFVGKHDFLALCAAGSSAAAHGDTVRTITACGVERKGDEVEITVTADGYLYNMVRILAGTLCEVGAGRMQPEAIPGILASRDRHKAGPTLPAKGLFLKSVEYD